MERPIISKQTSFNPIKMSATVKSRPMSSSSQRKSLTRPASSSSVRSGTPTTGYGPHSLNQQIRKKSENNIRKQNLKMVNSLLCAKPLIPLATDLKKWADMHDSIKKQITLVRYGSPTPVSGVAIKLRLSRRNSSGS